MPEPIVTSNGESLWPDLREPMRRIVGDILNGPIDAGTDDLVGAARHERTADREAHRAGSCGCGLTTSSGEVDIRMPEPKGRASRRRSSSAAAGGGLPTRRR